jgi:dihydrofolate synthase/folylpolyglutamate synthase
MLPIERIELGLNGRHQIENAKVATAVAELLRDRFPITDLQIVRGLETARHPGRLEWIGHFLLDGAHNVGGAKALADYLDEFVVGPIIMVFGAMEDKNVGEIASVLFPKTKRLVLTTPSNSRAIPAEQLGEIATRIIKRDQIFVIDAPSAAVKKAVETSGSDEAILVTGSLYLVGEVRAMILPHSQI